MNTRSMLALPMVNVIIASSATSTVNAVTIDLANYFPVGKREVKFVVGCVTNSTAETVLVTLEQSASSASAASTVTSGFSTILDYAGSSAAFTSTAAASTGFEFNGIVTSRYVRAKYNAGQATTGSSLAIVVMALPIVRAA